MAIEQKFTGDTGDIEKAYQRMQKDLLKVREELANVKKAAKEAGNEAKKEAEDGAKAFAKMEQNVAGVVTQYIGWGAAIAVVNAALRDQIDMQDKAADAQRTAADAQIKFLRNLGNVSQQERQSAIAEVGAISERTGVSQKQIYQMASTAVSARGAATLPEMFKTVESAARIAPEDTNEGTAIAGGMLDAAALTGTFDADRNRGLLVQLQQQARSTSMQAVSKHVIPAAISVKSYGASTEEASAAITSMTNAMKDPEGAVSGTSMIALAQQAEGVTKGGFGEDVAKLRSDPKLRDAFMKKASFERRAESFVKDFLTEGSPTAKLYDQFKKDMPTAEQSAAMSAEFEQGIMSPDIQQAAKRERASATKAESTRVADLRSGDYSRIRKQIEDEAQAQGIGWESRAFASTLSRVRGLADSAYGRDATDSGLVQVGMLQQDVRNNRDSGYTNKATAEAQLRALEEIKNELTAIRGTKTKNINAQIEQP